MSDDRRFNEVIRVQKRPNNYTMIDTDFLNNSELSWKAKGILAYLLSKPDNWKVIIGNLVNNATDGKTAVYNGLAELSEHGYYEKVAIRSEDGRRIDHWESTVYELPKATNPINAENTPSSLLPDFQEVDNQEIGNQDIDNQPLTIFNNNYTDCNNIQSSLVSPKNTDRTDTTDDTVQQIEAYYSLIKENISYSDLAVTRPYDMKLVDEFIAIIVDTVLTEGKTIWIGKEEKPRALVTSQLMKLTYSDIELVIDQFKSVTDRISKKKQYILTMLYNAKLEGDSHYTNLVKHDMWNGGGC